MRARGTIAARSKATRTVRAAEPKGLERRRGLLSFLTWAFFLADVLGRDGLAPSAAHAAEADEPLPAHGTTDAAPATHEPVDRPLTSLGDQAEPVTMISPGYTYTVPSGGGELRLSDSDIPNAASDELASRSALPQGLDAGSARASDFASSDDISPGAADPADALFHVAVAPDGLLHGVADTLGALPLVGNLLGGAVETVASTVESLVGGLGGLLSPHGSDGAAVASGGSFAFDSAPSTAPSHEIETTHGFTDFGIALELGLPGTSALSFSPSAPPELASFSSDPDASHLSIPADHGLPDEAGQRASADVLA
jgi:hypothetical protein